MSDSDEKDYKDYKADSKNSGHKADSNNNDSGYKGYDSKYDDPDLKNSDLDHKGYYNADAKSNKNCRGDMNENDINILTNIISKYNIHKDSTNHPLYNKRLDALKEKIKTPKFNIHDFPIFDEVKNIITKCVDNNLYGKIIGPIKLQISWLLIDNESVIDFINYNVNNVTNNVTNNTFNLKTYIKQLNPGWDVTKNGVTTALSVYKSGVDADIDNLTDEDKENIKINWDKIRLYFMDIEQDDKSSKEVKNDSNHEKTVDVDDLADLAASYLKLIGFFRIEKNRMEKAYSSYKRRTGEVTPKNYLKKIFNLNDNEHFKDVNLMNITGETAKKHLECNEIKAKEFGEVIEDIFRNKNINAELTKTELDDIIDYFELFCNTYNPRNNVIRCTKAMPCVNNNYGGNSYNGGDHIAPGKDDIISSKPVKQNVKKNTKKKRKEKKRKVSKQKRIKYRNKNRTKIKKGSKIQTKKRKI